MSPIVILQINLLVTVILYSWLRVSVWIILPIAAFAGLFSLLFTRTSAAKQWARRQWEESTNRKAVQMVYEALKREDPQRHEEFNTPEHGRLVRAYHVVRFAVRLIGAVALLILVAFSVYVLWQRLNTRG